MRIQICKDESLGKELIAESALIMCLLHLQNKIICWNKVMFVHYWTQGGSWVVYPLIIGKLLILLMLSSLEVQKGFFIFISASPCTGRWWWLHCHIFLVTLVIWGYSLSSLLFFARLLCSVCEYKNGLRYWGLYCHQYSRRKQGHYETQCR